MALIFQYYECNEKKKQTLKMASVVNTPHYEMYKKRKQSSVCIFTFDSTREYKLYFQDGSSTIALFFFLLCEFRSFPQKTTASGGTYMCCFGARDVNGAQT